MLKNLILFCLVTVLVLFGCQEQSNDYSDNNENYVEDNKENADVEDKSSEETSYIFPHENDEHEGTWLQWPHNNTYENTTTFYDPIWIEMTRGLIKGENVHIIVYDENEKERVINLLKEESIDMTRIDFFIFPTDDVWSRDNGPIFVYDSEGNLYIQNWEFNGWGNKAPFKNDNEIPNKVAEAIGVPSIDIKMVMEGGALEVDGNGTLFSTLSCVNNDNRTANYSLDEIEEYLRKYYGVTNFIWLDGVAGEDITDNHIDGMIKVVDDRTIIADSSFDLDPDTLSDDDDVKKLLTAKNVNGETYNFVFLPETKENVVVVQGEPMKGAYLNFYVANKVVLVPNYEDENDKVANAIIQKYYPNREVIGIDVRDLYADGGMIHCVTQQQPIFKNNTD